MGREKCSHSGCGCEIEPGRAVVNNGKNYCSNHCATATGTGQCKCGHPDCQHK